MLGAEHIPDCFAVCWAYQAALNPVGSVRACHADGQPCMVGAHPAGPKLWGLFKPLSGGGMASPCVALGLTELDSFAGSDLAGLSVLIS